MESISFLEILANKAGCNCLSDLRLQQKKWVSELINILENVKAEDYSVAEWKEVISYLTDTELDELEGLDSRINAKDYIIQWLYAKRD